MSHDVIGAFVVCAALGGLIGFTHGAGDGLLKAIADAFVGVGVGAAVVGVSLAIALFIEVVALHPHETVAFSVLVALGLAFFCVFRKDGPTNGPPPPTDYGGGML